MVHYDDLVDYFIKNPPLELADDMQLKYRKLVNDVADQTLLEYSEYYPSIREKEFTTNTGETEIDIYTKIDRWFMDFIIFDIKDNVYNLIRKFTYENNYTFNNKVISESGSFLNLMMQTEILFLMKEYFEPKVKKIVYNNSKIKVKEETKYYCLYEAYLDSREVSPQNLVELKKLLGINILIELYNSPIFASEGGIKSVSLSGLSVSFNIPSKENLDTNLQKIKQDILSSLQPIDEVGSF